MTWAINAVGADNELSIEKGAESLTGPSIKYFTALTKKLKIYLCLAFAEKATKTISKNNTENIYYNSQILINPEGKIIAHHRKKNLWPPGDGRWASRGNLEVQVVDTEYGKLGLMICFDLHILPPELAIKKADIILYSVGWFGPNEENWFHKRFPRDYVEPYKFSLILANWSADELSDGWPGLGFSTIYNRNGNILSKAKDVRGSEIIYAVINKEQP
jgi:predicted amidohydrolase